MGEKCKRKSSRRRRRKMGRDVKKAEEEEHQVQKEEEVTEDLVFRIVGERGRCSALPRQVRSKPLGRLHPLQD